MQSRPTYAERNRLNDVLCVVVGGALLCLILGAMVTARRPRSLPNTAYRAVAMHGPYNAAEAQLVALPTNPVELGFGVSIIDMNRSIAQDRGVRYSSGGYVTSVKPNSPADRAGLRPGDIINRINGK
jgi:membrane-associated protease RseP (regulator of RpoE activity)